MITDNTKNEMLNYLRGNGNNISDMCDKFGISRRSFYNCLKDKDYNERYLEIKERNVDMVESAFYKSCLEGNIAGQIFYLKTQGKSRGYIEDNNLNLTVSKLNLDELPDDLLDAVLEKIKPADD